MGKISRKDIEQILTTIYYPGFSRDIVSFGVVKNIVVQEKVVQIRLKFTTQNEGIKDQIKSDIQEAISEKLSEYKVDIVEESVSEATRNQQSTGGDPWAGRVPIPGIKRIIAVASGKGGVGKSTISTNLAIALAKQGFEVGLMDSDIYGPSIHIMMGVEERPKVTPEQKIIPIEKYGVRLMSMGFLIDDDAPLIWRGPLVMKAVEQFLHDVEWSLLDVLVIDLPPGTGDAQLTLVQKTPITGAVIVTTPQEVALIDARRGLKMFQKVGTKVLGIIENMSYFVCPSCGKKTYIFGSNGAVHTSKQLKVPLLGQVPIESQITTAGDEGVPIVIRDPESLSAKVFIEIVRKLMEDRVFQQ
ncbi:hypothetical protein AC481_00470 [miscellaneous Crenarchaeota group archaeon SMTZ-80]|jgi:ATP-binding protein involved in chromosome partitioning|nr:MAG: hypothetical protein AC481_00470 [miscellaneous Crenarchaeota group archaeon SMTZ-80]